MTDSRERRITALTEAAKAKSQSKTRDAEQAIRRLVKRGEPITFQAVQREAGVSHAFLYNHPELRKRIEHLRGNSQKTSLERPADADSTLVITLTRQIAELKKQHRQQLQALRDALERAHGENLDLRRELARRGIHPSPNVASIATTS
jgi:methylthioribose-1-phosphate isomerase